MKNIKNTTTHSVRQKIIDNYENLSNKEKRIADYIIENHRMIFTHSAVDLAKHTGSSPATVVRFSQHLGYEGYYQLKNQIIDEMKVEMIPEERFKLLTHEENSTTAVLKIAKQEVFNINKTINQIEKESFETFIETLSKARLIYTFGIGMSSILSRLSAYLFNQAGLRANFCGQDEHSFIEKLINLSKTDVAFGFSLPPYSQETIKSMKFCYERGVKCLSITNALNSPITKWSHSSILASTENLMFTNSISAISMIINALATELALLNKRKLVPNIDQMSDLLKDEYMTKINHNSKTSSN
ncbi:MAG: MurR/RpiR family transcriptional regulator [Candidatus Aminicenantes bacterium]|nr:MurR/RpiR family transcriptional regulator [Candidatus Aminicenantes bacterium]